MRRILIAALGIVACLAFAGAALAASGQKAIKDCTDDGRLQGHYTQSELRQALANLPTDVDEYTDCRDVLRRAQLGGDGGGSGGSGGSAGGGDGGGAAGGAGGPGSSDPLSGATAEERAKIQAEINRAKGPGGRAGMEVGGQLVRPGTLGFKGVSSISTVPTVLLVVLTLLAVAALAGLAYFLRSRVVTRSAA